MKLPLMLKCSTLAVIILHLLLGSLAYGIPKYGTTNLPVDKRMATEENREMLNFLASFTVYPDTEDSRLFYYLPVFKMVSGRAATVNTNDEAIGRRGKIEKLSEDSFGMNNVFITSLSSQYSSIMGKAEQLSKKGRLTRDELQVVKSLHEMARRIKNEYDKELRKVENVYYSSAALNRMADLLGFSGFALSLNELKDAKQRARALSRLSMSNGGLFTANVYATVENKAPSFLSQYHQARAKLGLPQVKVVRLPIENITWHSLTETVMDSEGKEHRGIPLYRNIKGGGNFKGATINIDLTLDGAKKFVVILPVVAKGYILQKYPPFKATLKCDFTTGWTMKGRSDVIDGMIIYDNDVYNRMVAKDVAETGKPCSLKFEGGGHQSRAKVEAAHRKALEEMQKKLADIFINRTELARKQKEAYFNGVMQDVQRNRRQGGDNGWGGVFGVFVSHGWFGGLIAGFGQASNIHWHTHVEDIKMLSKLKWEQEIIEDGNSYVEVELPGRLCVAFNPQRDMYIACSDEEMRNAVSSEEAYGIATNSDECSGANEQNNPVACGERRREQAPINPQTGNIGLPAEL